MIFKITNLATMKKLPTFLLTLFLISSVYAESRVVDKLEYRDGIAYAVGESEGFSGAWVNTGANGNKASELNYKDGLQDGLTTKWFPNGAKGTEANYKNGKLHGTETEWNINGAIESKTNYINGKGKKLYRASFYWSGKIKYVDKYVDGKLSKSVFFYDRDIRVDEYADGKLSKSVIYHKDGYIEKVDEYADGKLSKSVFYHKDGYIEKVHEYADGKLSKSVFYHRDGDIEKVQEYADGDYEKAQVVTRDRLIRETAEKVLANMKVLVDSKGNITTYDNGEGILKDDKQAAEKGNSDAQYNLALMYAYGEDVLKNMTKAKHWIKKAYERADAEEGDWIVIPFIKVMFNWIKEGK